VVCPYGITLVVALLELLAVFGSVVVEDTDAVFVIVVFFDGGVTTIVTVAVEPLPIVPRLQVTIRFVGWLKLQVPWVVVTVPNAVFLGSWSVTEALAAASGPPLCTVSVYVRVCPVCTGSGEPVLVSERSAPLTTVVVAVAVLFAEFGSAVTAATVA
jgi:hypothetical protein